MWPFLGALAGGAMSLAGGIMGQENQAAINQQNLAAAQNFAQNSISWRVADANRAGINPLAALGSSFSPSAPQMVGSNALPEAMNNAGQDISRATQAYQDSQDRLVTLNGELLKAQIDKTKAETVSELATASKAARLAAPGSPPPFPPLPRPAPGYANTLPSMWKDWNNDGKVKRTMTDEAARATSGPNSAALWPGLNIEQTKNELVDVYNWLRPDERRTIDNMNANISNQF